MANASLYSILGGLGQSENEYLAEDPWFRAGVGLQQSPQPAYTSNTDAILMPILMGLSSGAMQGYGRGSAQQAAGQDYGQLYKSLTGQQYNPMEEMGPVADPEYYGQMLEEGPQAKSIDTMRGEILMEVLNKQAKQEQEAQLAIDRAKFMNEFGPEAVKARAFAEGEIARAKAKGAREGEQPAATAGQGVSLFNTIQTQVPKELQKQTIEEIGTINKLQEGFERVDQLMDQGYEAAKDISASAPTSAFGIPLPTSKEKRTKETVAAGLTSVALSVWKGPLDEKDAQRILDPYIPSYWDTPETIQQKKEGLKELLKRNAAGTPTVELMGIASRPDSGATQKVPPPAPLPGETRERFKARVRGM